VSSNHVLIDASVALTKKKPFDVLAEELFTEKNRGDRIRTCDLVAKMEVSHVTVTRILQRLGTEGLINKDPYGPCTLTNTGTAMARGSRRRHALLLDCLLHIGVPAGDAERDAEGMEHHVSYATLAAMRATLQA
jgi:DtxR family manganese transport transcriptional regulator